MKEYYLLLFMGVTIVLLFCTLSIGRMKDPLVKYAQRVLNVAILAVMARAVATMTASEHTANIAFSIFFACIDWILLFFIDFCFIYTNGNKNNIWYSILTGVVAFDSVSMVSNIFTGFIYRCYPIITDEGDFYYRTAHLWPFKVHLMLCYAMIVFIMYMLAKQAHTVSRSYRAKYVPIIICFVIIVVWNAVYMFLEKKIDISVFGYGILGLVLNYFALVYEPKDHSEKPTSN